jgi:hypothetical protein
MQPVSQATTFSDEILAARSNTMSGLRNATIADYPQKRRLSESVEMRNTRANVKEA